LRLLDVPVAVGVGATLDFLAGRVQRAPLGLQKYGLEWLFRLRQEPRRLWRRYLKEDLPFALRLIALHALAKLRIKRPVLEVVG
jgi:N-acetylglucosaminyldiphosphoundecaprenol N-acetyl-beta-D-mannosaminyltransferase